MIPVAVLAVVIAEGVLRPAPAATRLAGVSVAIAGYTIDDLGNRRHRLNLTVRLSAARTLDECVGFTLDEPFASRRLDVVSGSCARPTAPSRTVALVFERLTDDDLSFPTHTLVWGMPGGRCGIVFEVTGVCVVDQAGSVPLELPAPPGIPTFGPIGSLGPIFTFPSP